MNKINILDSSIFNRIAAGEVVERPYSVLKELLDNSIDAKASEIEIRVYEGGIKQIQVADNGSGIEYDDLPRVFLPHATSKIKSVHDLDKIGTLGFRGEALEKHRRLKPSRAYQAQSVQPFLSPAFQSDTPFQILRASESGSRPAASFPPRPSN